MATFMKSSNRNCDPLPAFEIQKLYHHLGVSYRLIPNKTEMHEIITFLLLSAKRKGQKQRVHLQQTSTIY